MIKNQNKFLELFAVKKAIIGRIRLKGYSPSNRFKLALEEIETYLSCGVDAVLIENYFGNDQDVEKVLQYLSKKTNDTIYGVNILERGKTNQKAHIRAFELANKYNVKFIQIDSVAGNLTPVKDTIFGDELNRLRQKGNAPVIGGVRFKHQPVYSRRGLAEDVKVGMSRSEGIIVTGSITGAQTNLTKIREFKRIIRNKSPLIIGGGLTAENCLEQLMIADAGIVGSYFKENYVDFGNVSRLNTLEFMDEVKKLRKTL